MFAKENKLSKRNYYEVLGVGRKSTGQELRSAYRKLALQYHPDRNPDDHAAEERFKEVNEAYSVLSNPESRLRYDRFGHARVGPSVASGDWSVPDFGGFEDILGDLFGGRSSFHSVRQRGANLHYDLEITLEQAAAGFKTQITIHRLESCGTCSGSGAAPGASPVACNLCGGTGQVRFQQGVFSVSRTCQQCRGAGRMISNHCKICRGQGGIEKERQLEIKIPAGVDTGTRLRLTGEGNASASVGAAGDLYVVIHVKEHELFQRQGSNVYINVPITFTQAALGSEIKVPTLDGEDTLTVPAGSQTGSIFRLKDKGIVSLQGHDRRGDQFVVTTIVTPSRLTREQRQLLEEFAIIEDNLNQGTTRQFVGKVKISSAKK